MKIFGAVLDSPRTVWAAYGVIYAINCVLECMRPEMAMEFGSAKKNRYWMSGLPTDNPLALFWDCKNSPSLYEMDQKFPCIVCMKLFEMNGLSWVEINRLMNDLDVLTWCHNYMEYNCVYRPLEMELCLAQVS